MVRQVPLGAGCWNRQFLPSLLLALSDVVARTNEEEGSGEEPEHKDDMVVFFLEPELHPPRVRRLFPRARTRAEPTGYMVWQPR